MQRNTILTLTGFLLFLLFVYFLGFYGKPGGFLWQETRSSDERFSFCMPGTPREDIQQEMTSRGMTTFVQYDMNFRRHQVFYSVGYTQWPSVISGPQAQDDLFREAMRGLAEMYPGQVNSEVPIAWGNYAGRDVTLQTDKGQRVRVRVLLVENRLYQVLLFSKPGDLTEEDESKFIDSFKLLKV